MEITKRLAQQNDFTATDKSIADYILAHLSEIPELYIQDLADQTFTSHSAVIRLCQRLGLAGYRELKIELAKAGHLAVQRDREVNPNLPFTDEDSAWEISQKMADLTTATIRKTQGLLVEADLEKAVTLLSDAKRIFLVATGDSQIRARSFQNKFTKLNKYLIIADEYGETDWHLLNLTAADCAVFISYGNRRQFYHQSLAYLTKVGIPVILLTGEGENPLNEQVSVCLYTPAEEYDYMKIATFSSQIAFDYLLNVLFSALYSENYFGNLTELKRKNELINQIYGTDKS